MKMQSITVCIATSICISAKLKLAHYGSLPIYLSGSNSRRWFCQWWTYADALLNRKMLSTVIVSILIVSIESSVCRKMASE